LKLSCFVADASYSPCRFIWCAAFHAATGHHRQVAYSPARNARASFRRHDEAASGAVKHEQQARKAG
jgi:hypothetical protein